MKIVVLIAYLLTFVIYKDLIVDYNYLFGIDEYKMFFNLNAKQKPRVFKET